MNWQDAAKTDDDKSVQGQIFASLDKLEKIRQSEKVFVSYADTWTIETGDKAVLAIGRYYDKEKVIGIFNFSEFEKRIRLEEISEECSDLITGQKAEEQLLSENGEITLPAYGFYYLKTER